MSESSRRARYGLTPAGPSDTRCRLLHERHRSGADRSEAASSVTVIDATTPGDNTAGAPPSLQPVARRNRVVTSVTSRLTALVQGETQDGRPPPHLLAGPFSNVAGVGIPLNGRAPEPASRTATSARPSRDPRRIAQAPAPRLRLPSARGARHRGGAGRSPQRRTRHRRRDPNSRAKASAGTGPSRNAQYEGEKACTTS